MSALRSFNPATGEELGSVPVTPPERVQAVVAEVAAVQPFWAALPLGDRARYLERAAQVVIDEGDQIRDLIVTEQGRPRNEALSMEVLPSIDALDWIARTGPEVLAAERLPTDQLYLRGRSAAVAFEPLGVVAVLSPWHDPWSVALGQIALALMAGNGVVLKPDSLTPLVGERIARAFTRAGLPDGLLRVIHGPGTDAALVDSEVAKVFDHRSEDDGGGAPALVLADADLEHAVAGILWAAFANAGQSGSGVARVYVMEEVAEEFVDRLVEAARRLRVGNPLEWETEVGPMSSPEQLEHVRELVHEAVAGGAALLCGGPLDGTYFAPAVLTGAAREQIPGPALTLVTVASEDEAVALANELRVARAASVWAGDGTKGELFAAELQAATVWVNDHVPSPVHTRFDLYEYTERRLRVDKRYTIRDPWWHPYDETLGKALRQGAAVLYGRPSIRASALRDGAVPLLKLAIRLFAGAHVRRRRPAHVPTPNNL